MYMEYSIKEFLDLCSEDMEDIFLEDDEAIQL